MTDQTELAWAAGFMEGEGGFYFSRRDGRLLIQVYQNDRRPLDRFQVAVGQGRVGGPYQGSTRKNPRHVYKVGGNAKVIEVAILLWPYLGEQKQEQFFKQCTNFSRQIWENMGLLESINSLELSRRG